MALKISREFKVGLFFVLAVAIIYWGVNFLKGNDVFASGTVYYAVYSNTEGLTKAKAVQINGYQVGLVDEIYFHPDRSGRLIVKMRMAEEYPLAKNTVARIHSTGLLGEKSIQLMLGDPSTGMAQTGDTLRSDVEGSLTEEVNRQVAPIKAKAERLLGSLDTAVTLITGFLNEETRNNFVKSFDNLRRTFENLENSSEVLNAYLVNNKDEFDALANNLESISANLNSNNENITMVLSNLASITDSLQRANVAATFKKVDDAVVGLNSVVSKVNSGEGSLGALVNDRELYNNLADASDALNRLLLDIKYNPNKYLNVSVFGSKRQYSDEEIQEIEQEIKEREKQKKKEEKEEADK
jgi:phospholipid/cholesterol/gamma-HCH transport system substrate-binding protein